MTPTVLLSSGMYIYGLRRKTDKLSYIIYSMWYMSLCDIIIVPIVKLFSLLMVKISYYRFPGIGGIDILI